MKEKLMAVQEKMHHMICSHVSILWYDVILIYCWRMALKLWEYITKIYLVGRIKLGSEQTAVYWLYYVDLYQIS